MQVRFPSYKEAGKRLTTTPSHGWRFPTWSRYGFDEKKAWSYGLYYLVLNVLQETGATQLIKFDISHCKITKEIEEIILDRQHDNRRPLVILCLDKVLKANGYPTIRDLLLEALREVEKTGNDTVISIDELAGRMNTTPEKLVTTWYMAFKAGVKGIHKSVEKEAKYRTPDGRHALDSFYLMKSGLIGNFCYEHGVCVRHCYQDIKEKYCKRR